MYETKLIESKTLGEAWEKACVLIMTEGHPRYVEAPEYKIETKDLPLIIKVSDPFLEPRISPKANTNRDQADDYSRKFIFGSGKENENSFDYTYYSRLRCYPDCKVRAFLPSVTESEEELEQEVRKISPDGKCVVERIDQLDKAIKILKKDPTRRTVVMHTWIPYRDLMKFGPKRENTSSPCVLLFYPQIVDGKLHMFVVMKTNDLYNAWPENAYAFTNLQKYMADEVGVETGTYTHFAVSMHIYQDMYQEVNKKFNL
ncbi:MAG: thymidylate synthase [Candidatus Pacebacteria bacterium]|nr:thymidylate synthase [Candidatus Paceibacterota bacterium]